MTDSPSTSRLMLGRERCLIIGEVAQAHDGSLGMAHAFIDAIADAGADAVKFQTHLAAAETSREEPWRIRLRTQDETRYDYWKRMEFAEDHWRDLREHAGTRGLHFLSSPFSMEAVALLERVGVAAWKIASGEVTNPPLLQRVAGSGLPVLLSSGMNRLEELDSAVELLRLHGADVAVLQCTSMYPTPPERVGLNVIDEFRRRFACPVGLSDHSGTIFPGLAAAAMGIEVLEVHVTMSREMFGPDVTSSVTTGELRQLVQGIRYIEAMRSSPVEKNAVAEELESVRRLFSKSLVYTQDLPAGTKLQAAHVEGKKPGNGIAVGELPRMVGRRLARAVSRGDQLREVDLE